MSSVSLEQGSSYPNLEAMLRTIERKPKIEETYTEDDLAKAKEQGVGMAEHFAAFIEGIDKRFQRYFITIDEYHSEQLKSFWESIDDQYDSVLCSDHEDAGVSVYLFEDNHVALIARTDYSPEGQPVGVNYEAALLPDRSLQEIGAIALSQAMQ